jgi:hypothetical protein
LNRPKAILESLAIGVDLYGIIAHMKSKVERCKSTSAQAPGAIGKAVAHEITS